MQPPAFFRLLAPSNGLLLAAALGLMPTASAQSAPQHTGEAWKLIQLAQSSLVLARDGSLIGEIGREWRTSVPIASLPAYLPRAFVAVEDHRFYDHEGVDIVGIAGAIKDNILGQHRGASTITQQVVGNLHPDLVNRRDPSLGRKIHEQQAALEMERHYTKAQILEAYLNELDFGHRWFGVEAASRHFFGKPAAQLSIAEAATLAALPKSPVIYDPIAHPDRARGRRDIVLTLMADQHVITRAQADAAKRESLVVVPNGGMSAPAQYFVDAVRREATSQGIPVENGGYRIVTTADPVLQTAAVQALADGARRVEERPGYTHPTLANHPKGSSDFLQGLAIAMDPVSGDVLALVGGRDFVVSPFNRALFAVRQPGSAFKPIVYASALSDSIPPNELLADTAVAIPLDNGRVYRPLNSDGLFLGPMTMREALVKSRNVVAVQLAERVGMDSIAARARRMGIETPIARYPSSAIGASAVRPLQLVSAYTAFANLGAVVQPRFIKQVEDQSGKIVYAPPAAAPAFALDPRVAFITRDMMRDVVERGTATSVRRYVPASIPVAGKTGTTNDNTDVWFVGTTPELVAGVWLGFDSPKQITSGAAGGSLAAPIWGQMVARWYSGRTAGTWEPPIGVVAMELDRLTGQPPTPETPVDRRYTEYFLQGTEPGAVKLDPFAIFSWGPIGL